MRSALGDRIIRVRSEPLIGKQKQAAKDTDRNHYPTLKKLISRLAEEADYQDSEVEGLWVSIQANGELTYRIRVPRAEEFDGGHLPAPA